MFNLFKSTKKEENGIIENDFFEELRTKEYPSLDEQKHVYLDYTGGNLYSRTQLNKYQQLLQSSVLGNPHSTNPTSQLATRLVEDTRKRILQFFNANDYICIFTNNASAALKIVGECYPFTKESSFVLFSDNHNSVNGIREFCKAHEGTTHYAPLNYEDLTVNEAALENLLNSCNPNANNLFAFPAQSNVSGVKHNLNWIEKAHAKGMDVLLDAAAFVPGTVLDLSKHSPDFVSVSFYKIFGFPTGVGALLMHQRVFSKMKKPWFAGGTVTAVSVVAQEKFLAEGHERFEDGTLSYNTIPAVKIGLDYISEIGINRIGARTKSLVQYLTQKLSAIKHANGTALVHVFGPADFTNRGSNLILNFQDQNGHNVPFDIVEKYANARNISLRTGCFCNPGIDEVNNCISTEEMSKFFASRNKGNYSDIVAYLGKMRGATRISVGIASNKADLDTFIEFANFFLNKTTAQL